MTGDRQVVRTLVNEEGRLVNVVTVADAGGFVDPFPGCTFVCLIWDHTGRFDDDDRTQVARALLETGCRYVVCGGANCEAWHDAVDLVFVVREVDDPDPVRDAEMVMTSWHTNEGPEDVAFFFLNSTDFGQHEFEHYLVLHVGAGELVGPLEEAVRADGSGSDITA